MAIEQCGSYQFKTPFFPGESCEDIYNRNPESREISGYYYITNGPIQVYCGMNYTGSSCEDIYNKNFETADKPGYYRVNVNQWTFCNMTAISGFIFTCAGMGGGWRRIAYVDTSMGGTCPGEWRSDSNSGVSFCRLASDDLNHCSTANFSTHGISYQRVCGKARGYQKGFTTAFYPTSSIEGNYADGLLITHGHPRQHIWAFASGLFGVTEHVYYNCPCSPGGSESLFPAPSFVGNDYYCESGTNTTYTTTTYYFNDPLWDGSGCTAGTCCDNTNQPWFYKELDATTTDAIEARLCTHSSFSDGGVSGGTVIDQLELYIQ